MLGRLDAETQRRKEKISVAQPFRAAIDGPTRKRRPFSFDGEPLALTYYRVR